MSGSSLRKYRRITVKIGSALLVDRQTGLKRDWLASLVADIAALVEAGSEVLVVSSGAIALPLLEIGLQRLTRDVFHHQVGIALRLEQGERGRKAWIGSEPVEHLRLVPQAFARVDAVVADHAVAAPLLDHDLTAVRDVHGQDDIAARRPVKGGDA